MTPITSCPACGSTQITLKTDRVQANGITTGGGRCLDCRFTWTTVNGLLSHVSVKAIKGHHRKDVGSARWGNNRHPS